MSEITMANDIYLHTRNEFAIQKAAKADPDAQPLTDKELAKFKRANPAEPRLTPAQLREMGLI